MKTKNKYVTHKQTTTTEIQAPDLGQAQTRKHNAHKWGTKRWVIQKKKHLQVLHSIQHKLNNAL